MRRPFAATVVALSLAASALATGTSYADDDTFPITPPAAERLPEQAAPTAREALDRAVAALEGKVAGERRPDATLALRDLFVALPRLSGEDRTAAERVLARPTDGDADDDNDGYTVRSTRKCAKKVCLHWVKRTADAPPSRKWALKSLRVLKSVWRTEVGRLGYRRPLKDGSRGGNGKLDVYLKDVGSEGLYGYCAPEYSKPGYPRLASGYCVLDNDFAEFPRKPIKNLKATAAHEFFHAVQFGYDYREDGWLMEATATWMEERYADAVNDNRQYLRHGQLVNTWTPLDTFDQGRSTQYGNWAFFEHLSQRFGLKVVKRIWNQAGHFKGDGKTYSTRAVQRALPRTAPFKKVFAQFAAANTTPAKSYPEGGAWPQPVMTDSVRLGKHDRATGTVAIHHMAARDYRLTPRKALRKRKWWLRVVIDGPRRRTSPMATLVRVAKSGDVKRIPVRLNRNGNGKQAVPFNRRRTRRVYVVVANASTRFDCGAGDYTYSCRGTPRDDGKQFALSFRVFSKR